MLQFVCYLLRFHLASAWSRNNKHSSTYLWCSQFCGKDCNYNIWIVEINSEIKYRYLVVDAWAIMFPPIGFLGSAWNMEAPSTWATTWFVMITATPNWIKRGAKLQPVSLYHQMLEKCASINVIHVTDCVLVMAVHANSTWSSAQVYYKWVILASNHAVNWYPI